MMIDGLHPAKKCNRQRIRWCLIAALALVMIGFVPGAGALRLMAQDDVPADEAHPCAAYLKSLRTSPQTFSFPSNKTTYLRLAQGTELLIPANCFVLDEGPKYADRPLASGLIDLEVSEVLDPLDFALYNLPSQFREDYASRAIATHGAIRVKARCGGHKLGLGRSSKILILFPSRPDRMSIKLHGNHLDSEVMNWHQAYYQMADAYAGQLTPEGAKLNETYPFLGNIGKASPYTHRFEQSKVKVEDVVLATMPHPFSSDQGARVWLNGKGGFKRAEDIQGNDLGSRGLVLEALKTVQWDVSTWDTLKPIILKPSWELEGIAGSGVPEEVILFSNTQNAIEQKWNLEEMLGMMPLAKVQAFMDHAFCSTDLGWVLIGRSVEVGKAIPITLDLGIKIADAKVFLVLAQDSIVVEGEQDADGNYRFPVVPDGRLGRIIAMGFSPTMGPLLGVDLFVTTGGYRMLAMKSIPWSALLAMRNQAVTPSK
jgi:hypothetical protein